MTKFTNFVRNHKVFSFELTLVIVLIIFAIFSGKIAPHDPIAASLQNAMQPPSAQHWFGTDALGRDVFSRIIAGTRYSLIGTLELVFLIFAIGTALGIIAGYFGGIIDTIIMRLADTMISFPDLILAIAVVGILGPSLTNAMIAILVVSWTKYARLSRSLILKIRNRDFMLAAQMTGSGTWYIMRKYLLPNAAPTMIITAATDIGATMLNLAALSFLGFGIQPPTPEWGYMLSESRQYFQRSPHLLFFPGMAIFVVVVLFNLLGDTLRDVLDPRASQASDDIELTKAF